MITHYLENRIKTFSGFNRFSKFLLIGNKIDGYLNIDVQEFKNFEEVKKELPNLIRTLDFGGEWNLSFYQVPDKFMINLKWNYFSIPSKGKKIFELSYMNVYSEIEVFLSNSLIQFSFSETEALEDEESIDPKLNFEIYEAFHTIHLKEKLNHLNFEEDNYPGDLDLLYLNQYRV